eukprot:gb/GEZN01018835.1/.p2 GENE.gb/GEZN01018835.1/~~gb/GEZN01018835.1/.p2  ORF type:complete len:100 (-),score=5.15 gb/GEZN01018835.1/:327-626(-)
MFFMHGMSATEACCACGGGKKNGACRDLPLPDGTAFHDVEGPQYNCLWYGENPQWNCADADFYAKQGLSANQACCACRTRQNWDFPSFSTSSSPSPSRH